MRNQAFEQMKKRLSKSAFNSKTPIFAQFELTPRCNLDCKMCYVHNQDSNRCRERELSTEQWKRIFDEAYDCGLLYATLTGGECLLRDDFEELYLHLYNKRVIMTVLTNGTLINDKHVEFFKNHMPEKMDISIYGSDEEHYVNVTGHKGFEKTINAIKSLMAAGIDVRVSVTPSVYMGDDYLNIIRLCKENKFNLKTSEVLLMPNRDNPDKDDYYLSMEKSIELSIKRFEIYKEPVPIENLPDYNRVAAAEAKKGLVCNAGNCTASITWDGKIYPCTAIMEGNVSLLELSYKEAWEQVKAAACEVMLGAECEGCPYDSACPKCPALRLTGLHTGHANPAVCEMTKRLVAAGVKKIENK